MVSRSLYVAKLLLISAGIR